jgi:sporulation protein YlmC with PRC-barrel domain
MTTDGTQDWHGRELVDSDGKKVGTVEELYYDADTTRPEWAAVRSGLLGTKLSFVPITQIAPHGDQLRVPLENHRSSTRRASIQKESTHRSRGRPARSASRPQAMPTGESNRDA